MDHKENPMEGEDQAEGHSDSRIKVTLHETGILDEQQEVFLEMEALDETPCPQDQEVHSGKDPTGNSSQLSTDEVVNADGEGIGTDPSLAFTLTVEQCNEPERTLYVYNKPTPGSEVMIKVVSMTPMEAEGSEGEARDTQEAAVVQTGSDKDVATESQKAGEKEADSTVGKAVTEDIPEYSCEQCDFTTNKKHLHLSHQVLHAVPDKKQLFHCSECSYSTSHRFNLKTHIKSHFDIKDMDPSELFKCSECDYVSMYKYDLQTHSKKHNPDKQFRCFHCDFVSIYRHSLLHHISSKHHGVRPYQCSLCSYSAAKKQDLETHMFKHSKQKRYKCSECDYETTFRHCLQSHMHTHKGDKPFHCTHPGCTFSTNSKSNLTSHSIRHTKRLRCETCGFEGISEKSFTDHKCREAQQRNRINKQISMTEVNPPSRKEDGKLEYRCKECSYVSNNKHSMKRHSQIHNTERERPDKVHQCNQCNYVTAYKSSLNRHMATHSLVKPFRCGHCDYSAITMTQMHTHIAKHTGIKKYACELCNYSTANKQHLTNHMSKHSELRYKCNTCGHITAWKERMRIHLKQHEQGRIVSRRSSKSLPRPLGSAGFRVLSGEGGRLVTTDGQVLQGFLLEDASSAGLSVGVAGNKDTQQIGGNETMVVLNQLAEKIQEQIFESKAKEVSQRDNEDGTLMIAMDDHGADLQNQLLVVDGEWQESQSGSETSLQTCNETSITSTAVEAEKLTSAVIEISGEAT